MLNNKPRVITIGVYGFDEKTFFQALDDADVDTFCDIRMRRGMRGPAYSFVNAARLQQRLAELGIHYLHAKYLAPSQTTRNEQVRQDKKETVAKRNRRVLGAAFVHAYTEECLSHFNAAEFIEELGPDVRVFALFCVEREPEACHRSLVAARLARDLALTVEHVKP